MQMFLHISSRGEDENEMRWLDVSDGFLVINAMRELGLRPSRMSLEALLDGCAALNDSEQAHRVFQEMEREGLLLNIFSMIRCIFTSNSLVSPNNLEMFSKELQSRLTSITYYQSREYPAVVQMNVYQSRLYCRLRRLFRAYVAGEDEEKALDLLHQMTVEDLKDSDVRLLLVQTLQPHYVAAADSPIAGEALETLPRVRKRLDELLGGNMIPDTDMIL